MHYVNFLRLPRTLRLEPDTYLAPPRLRGCPSSPGQICTMCQQWTPQALTSPNTMPTWIMSFSIPACLPTLWAWPRSRDTGTDRITGGKVILQDCSRSAPLTLKPSIHRGSKSLLTAKYSRNLKGKNREKAFLMGMSKFTLYTGQSCIWRSKIIVKS